MADANLTLFTDLLVEDVQPSVNDQLEYETFAYSFLRKNAEVQPLKNFNYTMPVRKGRTSGNFGVTEANNNVVHGAPSYDESILTAKTITTASKITHQALAVNSDGSVTPLFDQLMKDLSTDYMHHVNRMTFGTSDAVIGTANGLGSSATTLVLDASTNGDIDYTEQLAVGQYISIGGGSAVQISAIPSANTITLAAADTWADGDSVKVVDSSGNASVEITGFGTIFGTGSLQGIDGSTNPFWQAHRVNHAGALSSESTISQLITKRNKYGKTDAVVTNATLFGDYGALLTTQKRAVNSAELKGGWSNIELMGGSSRLILDFDCPDSKFYGMETDALTVAELEPFHFIKPNGSALNHIDGTLNYEVIGVHIFDLAVKRRNALWELYGVTS